MPTTIRNARAHDLNELVLLCIEHAAYERSSFDPAGKEQALHRMLFAPDARLRCLVVEEGGALVGYATYSCLLYTSNSFSTGLSGPRHAFSNSSSVMGLKPHQSR